MKFKYALFDFDGTVINSIPAIVEGVKETFGHFNFPIPDDEEIKKYIGIPLKTYFPYLDPKCYENHHPDDVMNYYRNLYENKYSETHITVYEGMDTLLKDLKASGVMTGIVSSKLTEPILMNMRQFKLEDYFDEIVGCDQVSKFKPLPETVFLCAQRLGIEDIRDAIVIGDSPKDIEMGQRAGCSTCAVPWGAGTVESLRESKPDFYADTMEKLRSVLLA